MRRALPLFYLCCLPLLAHASEDSDRWKQVRQEDDITVYERSVPGTSDIEFKALGVIDAPMIALTAVIFGDTHGPEWQEHCAEASILETKAPDHLITYNRFNSGVFFVADRDMVMDINLLMDPMKKTIKVDVHDIANYAPKPAPQGVVRLASLKGFWQFERRDDGKVMTTYQMSSDPSGAIPTWLVQRQARDAPLNSIKALRKQVQNTALYNQRVAELRKSFDWKPYEDTH